MTQPTIKEKIEKIISLCPSVIIEPGSKNEEKVPIADAEFLQSFARLICEDILKHDDEFGFATEMHRRRALEEKCQEILKALE